MTDQFSDDKLKEIREGLEGVTPGPWKVVIEQHPWALPERQFLDEVIAAKQGTHTERRIFTTWDDGQLKGPWPIVNGSVGIGMTEGEPRHMVWIDEADARHIARMSPDTVSALLDRIDSDARRIEERDAFIVGKGLWQEFVEQLPDALRSRPTGAVTEGAVEAEPDVFMALRTANIERQAAWCPEQVPDLSFRGNELAGETGEVCNVIKKLERERLGWRGSRDTIEHLAEELADVVICADLVALSAGIDLNAAVIAKFNATSEKVGLPHRLASPSLQTEASQQGEPT